MATEARAATETAVAIPLPDDPSQVQTPIGGPAESLFPPFDVNAFPSHLLWIAIAFGLLYFFVNRLIVPQVGGILEDRRDRIASDLGEASRLARETDEVIAVYEEELTTARQKAFGIAQAKRDEIKTALTAKQTETEAALNKRIMDAEAQIAARRDAALADVNSIAGEAAQAIVEQVSGMTASDAEVGAAVANVEAPRA